MFDIDISNQTISQFHIVAWRYGVSLRACGFSFRGQQDSFLDNRGQHRQSKRIAAERTHCAAESPSVCWSSSLSASICGASVATITTLCSSKLSEHSVFLSPKRDGHPRRTTQHHYNIFLKSIFFSSSTSMQFLLKHCWSRHHKLRLGVELHL